MALDKFHAERETEKEKERERERDSRQKKPVETGPNAFTRSASSYSQKKISICTTVNQLTRLSTDWRRGKVEFSAAGLIATSWMDGFYLFSKAQ